MNYKRLYKEIIESAKSESRKRSAIIYYELHHITPRCLGGTDEKNNLVLLTGREHFIVHHLLIKIYPHEIKLKFAFSAMCWKFHNKDKRDYRVTSIVYENARKSNQINIREINKGNSYTVGYKHTDEFKKKVSDRMIGVSFSDEHKAHISAASMGKKGTFTGRTHSEESKLKMRLKALNQKPCSDETKKKISEKAKGRILSDEHKKTLSWSGRKHSDETKAKISKSKQNISEETRAKLSKSTKEMWAKRNPQKQL